MRGRIGLLVACTALGLGCKSASQEIQRTLNAYLDNYFGGRPEQAYDYLSEADRAEMPLEKYVDAFGVEIILNGVFSRQFAHSIVGVVREKAKAVVQVRITSAVVPPSAIQAAINEAGISARLNHTGIFAEGAARKTREQLIEQLRVQYKDEVIPSTTSVVRYELVNEGGHWAIFEDFVGTRQQYERKRERKAESDAGYAAKYIRIRDVQVTSYDGSGDIFVEGWVVNTGTETMTTMTLRNSLLDSAGQEFAKSDAYVTHELRPGQQAHFLDNFINTPTPRGWKKQVRVSVESLERGGGSN